MKPFAMARAGPNRKVEGRNGMVFVEEDWMDEQRVEHRDYELEDWDDEE